MERGRWGRGIYGEKEIWRAGGGGDVFMERGK